MSNTLLYTPVEDTHVPSASRSQEAVATPATPTAAGRRTTVLPRVEWMGDRPNVVPFQRERFEELRALGQGGMGEVVLLKDHDIERTVALKRLPAGTGLDLVLRFVEEIRTVGQLDHPNIVPVHDVGVDEGGRYYFVMKHLEGETLEAILAKLRQGDAGAHARFTFPVRVQIILGVLNALGYAHRKGFLHRDLKPANIMVGPYGEVTVMDWGLARRKRSAEGAAPGATSTSPREAAMMQTLVGSVMGTPLYMSPEQAQGAHDKLDERSDIYSLAVVMYEMLFLRHYLEGRESLTDVLEGVKTAAPDLEARSPHQTNVPVELVWFVSKGLKKDPAKRFASVEEMTGELQALIEGRIHVQCQRTALKSGLHRILRMVDSHPAAVIFVSTLAAAVVLASAVQFVLTLLKL